MKKHLVFLIIFTLIAPLISCGKHSRNLSSVSKPNNLSNNNNDDTTVADNDNEADTENPPIMPPADDDHGLNVKNDIIALWQKLKNQTYEAKVKDETLGTTVTKTYRFLPSDTQMAFCFADQDNPDNIYSNLDPYKTGFELASVSKIFTTLWTLNAKKENYFLLPNRFITNFYYNPINGELLIEGSLDPLFGIDRLKDALIKVRTDALANGYKVLKSISAIRYYNFLQIPTLTSDTTFEVSVTKVAQDLATDPNLTKTSLINGLKKLKSVEKLLATTNLDKIVIEHVATSDSLNEKIQAAKYIKIASNQRPLSNILLFLNSFSHNGAADLLYQLLGGNKGFYQFLSNYLPADAAAQVQNTNIDRNVQAGYDNNVPFAFYSGSGLPRNIVNDSVGGFKRNKATCSMIFSALQGLDESPEILNARTEEILPINGTGTLRRGVSDKVPRGIFIGKTGSLSNLLTMAGMLNTKDGNRPFFISVFRKNLTSSGKARGDDFTSVANSFIRGKVTTEFVAKLINYYENHTYVYKPNPKLISQLNVDTFVAKSYEGIVDPAAIAFNGPR